jgi:hypothetical protein
MLPVLLQIDTPQLVLSGQTARRQLSAKEAEAADLRARLAAAEQSIKLWSRRRQRQWHTTLSC